MPDRITLSRVKGWKMPENTVNVARGLGRIWGNPFKVSEEIELFGSSPKKASTDAVLRFRLWLAGSVTEWPGTKAHAARDQILARLPELRGKNLACWCKPGQPCHADVLLELANA